MKISVEEVQATTTWAPSVIVASQISYKRAQITDITALEKIAGEWLPH